MTNVDSIPSEIRDNIDLIVDSGEILGGRASTIIRVDNNTIEILREGPISREEIEEIC